MENIICIMQQNSRSMMADSGDLIFLVDSLLKSDPQYKLPESLEPPIKTGNDFKRSLIIRGIKFGRHVTGNERILL